MRINLFVAKATGMSRRAADAAVQQGRVTLNGQVAGAGSQAETSDDVRLDGQELQLPTQMLTILLDKPVGYVCSRDGQGSRTVYDLLPKSLHDLKTVGRLDKDSSGLLLMTNDGALAHQLTHPSFQKIKTYEVQLDKSLQPLHRQMIADFGVQLPDGPSQLSLERLHDANDRAWRVTMHEGRNRQIRRTFAALGYEVTRLRRTAFGPYSLNQIPRGQRFMHL